MESGGALRRSEEEVAAAASVVTCPECKKTFVSRKAMHGHLRCHPERNYRGVDPNPRAKLVKIETPAAAAAAAAAAEAGGDGGPPSLVVNANFLLLVTEHERLQSKKLIKRRVIKDDAEGNGESLSSYQALGGGGHMNAHTGSGITIRDAAAVNTSRLMEAKELPVLSEKEWIAVYALKRLREAARSAPPPRAAPRPPLAFDLNQLPPSEAEGEN